MLTILVAISFVCVSHLLWSVATCFHSNVSSSKEKEMIHILAVMEELVRALLKYQYLSVIHYNKRSTIHLEVKVQKY